jgi:hypothetical protein
MEKEKMKTIKELFYRTVAKGQSILLKSNMPSTRTLE